MIVGMGCLSQLPHFDLLPQAGQRQKKNAPPRRKDAKGENEFAAWKMKDGQRSSSLLNFWFLAAWRLGGARIRFTSSAYSAEPCAEFPRCGSSQSPPVYQFGMSL
jgi:hypothetical protein